MLRLYFDPFPELTSDRLRLDAIVENDRHALLFLRSDPGVMQYIDRPRAGGMEDIRQFIELIHVELKEGKGIAWAIRLRESPELIGYIGFWRTQHAHYRSEVGYALHPDHQGKGLAREALEAVIAFGFNQMGLHSIEANINPGNDASRQLLLRCGFVKEAYFRQNFYFNGQFLDSEIYSLLCPAARTAQ